MREIRALIRAAALTASSYRLGMVMSLVGLATVVVPLYFIATALQPVMAEAIAAESQQYFAFVVLGAMTFSLVSVSATSLPSAIENAIGRGTLEMVLGTPARLPSIVVGLMGYGVLWALLRASILVTVGITLGAPLFGLALLPAAGILALTMLAYAGVGLMLAACILVFRTAGPIAPILLTGSMFLGGVYYPTRVIPSWLRDVGESLPLTYGLRALRQVLLRDAALPTVAWDVTVLLMMTMALLIAGSVAFILALRRARRAGTLSTY